MLDVNILFNHANAMLYFLSGEQTVTFVGQPNVTKIGITNA
jgi:hypothetical protein